MGGEMQAIDRVAAGSLLGWWRDAGVDVAVGETPRDRLGRKASPPEAAVIAPAPQDKPADLASFQAWLATASGLPMDRSGAIRVASLGVECATVIVLSAL